jgi:hypothetical protein
MSSRPGVRQSVAGSGREAWHPARLRDDPAGNGCRQRRWPALVIATRRCFSGEFLRNKHDGCEKGGFETQENDRARADLLHFDERRL